MTTLNLSHSSEYDDHDFSDLNLAQEELTGYTFENCTFRHCNLNGANLSRARFISCKFVNCDLSNVVFKNSRVRDTSFEACKLVGVQWVQLDDIVSPSFSECHLNYCNFVGLKLKKTNFLKSSLKEADFSQADLAESCFRECDLSGTRFNESNLVKADFRGALNYLIDPIGNKVRGARFSLPEAQGLLAGLGIVID